MSGLSRGLSRRLVLGSAVALAACEGRAKSQPALAPPLLKSLKDSATFPVGTCVQVSHLDQPLWVQLARAQCSQLTPEWEMKMEYILQPDGTYRFDRPDRIAAFAKANGQRLYCTTLVWYAQKPDAFVKLDESRVNFASAFDNYITTVVGRYRGQAVGWDVVNEAVAEDGEGWRQSLWADKLGDFDHMRRAFDLAKAADPHAVLFINDYNLESLPKKFDTFQRLVERLLKAGAPVGGLGCQSHLAADLPGGAMTRTLQALARFGLPIHVSELDVSLSRVERRFAPRAELERGQAALYTETAEAFAGLPEAQRFALTLWGLRDKDSWLRGENAADAPAPFNDDGWPKDAAHALSDGLSAGLYGNAKPRR
ncbi:MAG: endo-1,4-beta-xylanase [Phenylobacterium sp.]|uniref:endo-1,4-beta-xylanase n=1 Tax=Phenylobacterium sp. TaxID=1871053 RepID=UPI00273709F7|nr:endo-1,4-beta-xylanase [Phenylobacterium sp.]MDP3174704.1 endo-1,4-beta-xylanase [Phenylobacterium sp.]